MPEDTALHRSLVSVKADDADVGMNGEIYYRLAEPSDVFAVHPLTGDVTLTRPLVFADDPFYEIDVLADDRGPHLRAVGSSARATVRIHVVRVNQHAPRMTLRHLPEVIEQSRVNVYAVVRVDDQDQGPSGQVTALKLL